MKYKKEDHKIITIKTFKMKVIKSPTLIDKSGADLTLSKDQFLAVMNKDTLEKEAKIKKAFKDKNVYKNQC